MNIRKSKINKQSKYHFFHNAIKKGEGFTLIELIIYIAIVAVILLGAFNFGWEIIFGNIKSQTEREVQQNTRLAMEKITRNIERALVINTPSLGNSSESLSLKMPELNLTPTVLDVFDNKLRITEGANPPYYLTNDQVAVKSLKFTNLSYNKDKPGTVRVELTLENVNPGGKSEYSASFDIKSTVSLAYGGFTTSYLNQLHYRWRNDDGKE